jgi:hypothetical protein
MEQATVVKRIIDGRSYNTETGELVAYCSESVPFKENDITALKMYRTRAGAYFYTWLDDNQEIQLKPLTHHRARASLKSEDREFGKVPWEKLVPEAVPEDPRQTDAVIYFRASREFKARVERAAKEANQSVNAWLLRVVEYAVATRAGSRQQR